jgi:hypothetical protein
VGACPWGGRPVRACPWAAGAAGALKGLEACLLADEWSWPVGAFARPGLLAAFVFAYPRCVSWRVGWGCRHGCSSGVWEARWAAWPAAAGGRSSAPLPGGVQAAAAAAQGLGCEQGGLGERIARESLQRILHV